MSHSPERDRLTEALANLPRHRPADQFTDQVLAALESPKPQRFAGAGRPIWVAASALILTALLALGYGYQRQRAAEAAYRAQVEELRSRYQNLLDEVATVRQEVATPETRLYLGGDERLDLVLDFSQTPSYQTNPQDRRDVRPASWEQ